MDLSLLSWGNAGWGDEFLRGTAMTLAVATCAFMLSIVLGTIFASMKLSQFKILRLIGDITPPFYAEFRNFSSFISSFSAVDPY